jgi:Escherichia/Staphylococcus phage prohead protease
MVERRFSSAVELRADGQGDELSVSGYAARWIPVRSDNLGGFREELKPGCFTRSLQSDRDIKVLLNHDPNMILGRKKNGSLTISEDARGLKFRCNIANTSVGRDVYRLIQRNDLSDCSFAFSVDGDDGEQWSECDDEETNSRVGLRTISRAKLYDVSFVGSPAYPSTSVTASSMPQLNSLTRDMTVLFPHGIPRSFSPEIRSNILRNNFTRSNSSRQKLMSLILN